MSGSLLQAHPQGRWSLHTVRVGRYDDRHCGVIVRSGNSLTRGVDPSGIVLSSRSSGTRARREGYGEVDVPVVFRLVVVMFLTMRRCCGMSI